ncbi:MAG: flagellar protein FlaG [Lachnospiraceae bacterium]|nr:flagellar protein FlaG [Lachnospiraceae bacterium]
MSMEIEKLERPVKNVPEYDSAATAAVYTAPKPKADNTSSTAGKDAGSGTVKEDNPLAQEKGKALSKETLDSAFAGMNSKLKMQRTRCEYEYDEATNRVSIKVYDKDTDELVLEAPPEESIEALKKTLEMAGIIVDRKY